MHSNLFMHNAYYFFGLINLLCSTFMYINYDCGTKRGKQGQFVIKDAVF